MNSTTFSRSLLAAWCCLASAAAAQDSEDGRKLVVTPERLEMEVGGTATLQAVVQDADGADTAEQVFFFSRSRRSVTINLAGQVQALKPGTFDIVVRTARKEAGRLSRSVQVVIAHPPIKSLDFIDAPTSHWNGVSTLYRVQATDTLGGVRDDVPTTIECSDPDIATVDAHGFVTAHSPGTCLLTARAESVETRIELKVLPNPVARIRLSRPDRAVRTGDVVPLGAIAVDSAGRKVPGAPIHWSFVAHPDDNLGNMATGQIEQDGRFVAQAPGLYTIVATCGEHAGRTSLRAEPRKAQGRFVEVGHGAVFDVHTSDLWVWEGADGRDYAVTGTWGAHGDALFWDVTDPSKIERIASVRVDARTVNDVKISADGTLAIISREGASNRRNGVVLIDVTNPAEPEILSAFDEELTGGVHNVFVHEDHVFALSAGRRYDSIDISDRKNPRRVGTYELATPGHSIHDVWIVDGIAYSSNWSNGVHIVDVGNGVAGGSPANPVHVADYAYPSGWNHAAFPYRDPQTGKFWVIAGDEAFPYGLHVTGKPTLARGWCHFIDFSDLKNPRELARYQVPEAGSHNFWVEDEVLYAAFYNGGVRAVDLSGDLLGDLYHQGREIAWFIPHHPDGKIPNASMVWGPQPYKGNIFFSDWNSGLWCVRLERPAKPE